MQRAIVETWPWPDHNDKHDPCDLRHLRHCTDYNSDNWEPESMTIFVTWQLGVTLDSIHNSCDVWYTFYECFLFCDFVENLNNVSLFSVIYCYCQFMFYLCLWLQCHQMCLCSLYFALCKIEALKVNWTRMFSCQKTKLQTGNIWKWLLSFVEMEYFVCGAGTWGILSLSDYFVLSQSDFISEWLLCKVCSHTSLTLLAGQWAMGFYLLFAYPSVTLTLGNGPLSQSP